MCIVFIYYIVQREQTNDNLETLDAKNAYEYMSVQTQNYR